MATMKDIIQSPLLLALVIGGLLYISAFSLVYLKKAYDHCLELGITRKELSNVIKSSLIFSVVPSLSIVVGLFVLIAVLGGLVGIFIIVMLPIGILTSYVLWKKGKIQVVDKEQKEK
ncbi:MAG: DUF5058 family protein [Faecalibacterium sp.]|nr:DUF5058 family protein [Faecalibacterium prausnitzii]